jgi:hypothetical protein
MERILIDEEGAERARRAGAEAARYCPPDPRMWLDRAAMVGMSFILVEPKGFAASFLEANFEEATFLDAWLHATPGAADAVEWLLRGRDLPRL